MFSVYKFTMAIMSFHRKGKWTFDVHVNLMLKLHLISNTFLIWNFRFSLQQVVREDNFYSTKWNQEPVSHQVAGLKVDSTLKRHQKYHGEKSLTFNFKSQIGVELSTSSRCYSFHVDSPFIIDEISTKFWSGKWMSNRWWNNNDVSIGKVVRRRH